MDLSQAERQKYAEIFSSLNPVNGYITGTPLCPTCLQPHTHSLPHPDNFNHTI